MAWTFGTPAVVDALVAAFKAAPGLAGVDVRDGPETGDESALEVLTVGWEGDDQGEAADTQLVQEGAAASPDREHDTVRCAAAVLNGAGNVSAARTRAYQLVDAAGAVLAADRRLGGLVMYAMVATANLRQAQTTSGLNATVIFTVEADAYTGR